MSDPSSCRAVDTLEQLNRDELAVTRNSSVANAERHPRVALPRAAAKRMSRDASSSLLGRKFLHPGHIAIVSEPAAISTILGSCIAVCLWNPDSGRAGMNHFLLPYWASDSPTPLRYGNLAMDALIAGVAPTAADRAQTLAKVFGGACVVSSFRDRAPHLGSRNAGVAMDALHSAEIEVRALDTGGNRGRKIEFDTRSGSVMVKYLGRP